MSTPVHVEDSRRPFFTATTLAEYLAVTKPPYPSLLAAGAFPS